jgi:hypothetical protein
MDRALLENKHGHNGLGGAAADARSSIAMRRYPGVAQRRTPPRSISALWPSDAINLETKRAQIAQWARTCLSVLGIGYYDGQGIGLTIEDCEMWCEHSICHQRWCSVRTTQAIRNGLVINTAHYQSLYGLAGSNVNGSSSTDTP